MQLRFTMLLVLLAVILSACGNTAPTAQAALPAQERELPPTPYPDTPAPPELDAPKIEAPALVHIDMLNELSGWAVTEAEVARTNDGGITWYNVTPPDVAETGSSVDAFFLDEEHAWVQKPDFENFPNSGILYSTTDGGMTWTSAEVPFSRGDLNFLDPQNGWALADLGVGAGSNAVAIYQTKDGGASWDQTYSNDPNDPNAADSLPLGGIKSDLIALDMKTAWVSGVTYAPGEVYLYRTDDGGHTWTHVDVPLPAGMQDHEISIDRDQMKFISPSNGFLVLRMSGETTHTAVYRTQDAGNTWAVPSTPLAGAGPSIFLSAQEAVLYNGEQFYITHDSGQTWVTVAPNIQFGDSFAGMEFVNPASGWVLTFDAANHRSLYRTTDGGKTWFAVVP